LTFGEDFPGSFDICPVCFWEDDLIQFTEPTYKGGANKVSLEEAQRNFTEFGASSREFMDKVRSPKPNEIPSKQHK